MKHKKNITIFKLFTAFAVFVLLFTVCAYIYDNTISESVSEISRQYAVTEINKSINSAISECIEEDNISTSDFIIINTENKSMSANSMLINKLCAKTAEKISYNLSRIKIPEAKLNLSMLSNFFSVFNITFNYTVDVTSVGSAEADYETEFTSAGINSTNFRVWLNIKTEVAIVDIFHTEKLNLTRKIIIIDSVIDGDVPSTLFQMKN